MSGWMARGRAQRAAALGLALRVLLSFGLGLEAAPTSIPTWSLTQAPGTKTLQEGSATSMGTPVTLESVTYLRNATVTSVGDRDSVQSGNRSAYGIIAAAGLTIF
ncbi:hypothetical protein E2I00_013656 [Balaenoptera physalus]|uniref:Uncharacterized protein n=1 Tax=Balaenoptera physalus TaxID=9770 RepID=A0A6A1PZM3_BALPH|nr:hypothetical protein E2I00_013656 [Balaenoptera physalus]